MNDFAELRAEVRAFIAGRLASGDFTPACDAWHVGFDPAFSRALGEAGYIGMTWPRRYGGGGRSALERYVVVEELLAAGAPMAAHWVSDRQTGPALLKHGTPGQRESLLPGMARGEIHFAIGMSEPDSGSDLAALRTRARAVDGGWLLSGSKIWTSHAQHCHAMFVLCRTSPPGGGHAGRHRGLSQLIVDLSSPGLTIRPIRNLAGSEHFCEVFFDEVFVPAGMLLGREGEGWRQVTEELAHERSGPERFLSTFPLLAAAMDGLSRDAGPETLRVLGELAARLLTLRQMSFGVARALAEGRSPAVEAALVKDLGTRFEAEVVDVLRGLEPDPRALGARYVEAVLLAPGATLRGGTNEILRGIVAKGLS